MNKLTVIIPTKNEEKFIRKCLNYLCKQTYSKFDILVVDGNSVDNTVKIAEEYGAKVIFEEKNKGGYGYARNLGVKYAKTKIIAFLDADIYLIKDWYLEYAVQSLKEYNNRFGIVGVCSRLIFSRTPLGVYLSRPFEQPTQIISKYKNRPPLCLDFSVWYRKYVVDICFDENFKVAAEDQDFYYRLFMKGYKVLYNSKIQVYHDIDPSLQYQIYRAYRFGKGTKILYKKYKIGDEGFSSIGYPIRVFIASIYSTFDCVRRIGSKAFPIFKYNYKLMLARRKGFLST